MPRTCPASRHVNQPAHYRGGVIPHGADRCLGPFMCFAGPLSCKGASRAGQGCRMTRGAKPHPAIHRLAVKSSHPHILAAVAARRPGDVFTKPTKPTGG